MHKQSATVSLPDPWVGECVVLSCPFASCSILHVLQLPVQDRSFKTSVLDTPREISDKQLHVQYRMVRAPFHRARKPSGRARGDPLVFHQSQSSGRRLQVPGCGYAPRPDG